MWRPNATVVEAAGLNTTGFRGPFFEFYVVTGVLGYRPVTERLGLLRAPCCLGAVWCCPETAATGGVRVGYCS